MIRGSEGEQGAFYPKLGAKLDISALARSAVEAQAPLIGRSPPTSASLAYTPSFLGLSSVALGGNLQKSMQHLPCA